MSGVVCGETEDVSAGGSTYKHETQQVLFLLPLVLVLVKFQLSLWTQRIFLNHLDYFS